jgi:hypothetical protein
MAATSGASPRGWRPNWGGGSRRSSTPTRGGAPSGSGRGRSRRSRRRKDFACCPALGGGADLRLAGTQSAAEQGLRGVAGNRSDVDLPRDVYADDGAAGEMTPFQTPSEPMTFDADGASCPAVTSRPGSPATGRPPISDWTGIAGLWSGGSPGSASTAAWWPATNSEPTSMWHFPLARFRTHLPPVPQRVLFATRR